MIKLPVLLLAILLSAGAWAQDMSMQGITKTIDADGTSRYYDMQGRPIQNKPTEKGIYIKNQRKVINNPNY